jgi:hypothetical protein
MLGVRQPGSLGVCVPVLMCLLAVGCGASRSRGGVLASAGFHSEPVQFLPGGMQTIARGPVTGTAGFSLLAERYRFQHRTYFNLAVNVSEIGGGSQGTNFTPEHGKPLAWSTEQGCSPSATMWTIVFGVLADPLDRAYASTAHGRYRLRTASIPTRFGATGVAAYVALPKQPTQILVTTTAGHTLMREQLETAASERCEPGTGIMILRKRSPGKTG